MHQIESVDGRSQEIHSGRCAAQPAFNYPFPIAIEKADGAYLWDVDGNRYIDFLQAGGPTVLGSNYAPVREKVFELLSSCGPVTGLFHEYELKLAKLIGSYMPSIEMFRMLGSGTESVMAAVRAARTYTHKKYIIKVGGAYHGWSDTMIYGLHVPGTGRLEAKGIPHGATASTEEFFPNSITALKRPDLQPPAWRYRCRYSGAHRPRIRHAPRTL
jgi:glutamate-1-semialdehyde 2,1-aminomutase